MAKKDSRQISSNSTQLSDLIEARKQNYLFRLTEKLRDRTMFLNNKKIPCVPSIFYENDFVIDLQEKAESFNDFFAKQCAVFQILANFLVFLVVKLINN